MDVYLFSCICTILLLTQRNILLQKTTTSTIIHIITIHSALSMSILHDMHNRPDSIQHLRSAQSNHTLQYQLCAHHYLCKHIQPIDTHYFSSTTSPLTDRTTLVNKYQTQIEYIMQDIALHLPSFTSTFLHIHLLLSDRHCTRKEYQMQ